MSMLRVVVVVVLVSGLLGSALAALAQTTQPAPAEAHPSTRPADQSAEEMLRQMLQPQGQTAQPLQPAPEKTTDLDDREPAAQSPPVSGQPLIREGTPLLDRVGRLTRAADGAGFEFTLESDGRTLSEPPLRLLPNRRLQQLEDRVRTSYRDLKISVSGDVTEYRGRNYLLLSRWSIVQDVAQPLR